MASPAASTSSAVAVELFSTSILSNHKVRNRHERYVSVLQVKRIPFVYHDLASDEHAKSRWRRRALDAQLPGLLVHDEWRGTFEEFEEAIEFGELDLFLRIDQERARREADEGIIPQPAALAPQPPPNGADEDASQAAPPLQQPRKPSKHVIKTAPGLARPIQPSMNALAPALPMAAPTAAPASSSNTSNGKRSGQHVDSFLRSLGIEDLNLTEEELNDVLEAGKTSSTENTVDADTKVDSVSNVEAKANEKKYPGIGLGVSSSQKPVPRTYIPSADAGTMPLRLAKMGSSPSGSSRSSSAAAAPIARYNASQISSRALAAEAQASVSSRSFSSARLRDAVSQGDDLKSAMSQTRLASNTDAKEQVVGREDIDELLASLGLDDVKMSEEEAESFLLDGTIPQGTSSGGTRVGRSASAAERARNEVAARDVAKRAREKGYGSNSDSDSSRSPSLDDAKRSGEAEQGKLDDLLQDTSVIVNAGPDETPKPDSAEKFTNVADTVVAHPQLSAEDDGKPSTSDEEEKTVDAEKESLRSPQNGTLDITEKGDVSASEPLRPEEDKVAEVAKEEEPSNAEESKEASEVEPVDVTDTERSSVLKLDDDKQDESTPRQKVVDLPAVDDTKPAAGLGEEGEQSADSAGTAKITEALDAFEKEQIALFAANGIAGHTKNPSSPGSPARTSSVPMSPPTQKSASPPSPPRPARDNQRASQLHLDSSFAALASQIQTGEWEGVQSPKGIGAPIEEKDEEEDSAPTDKAASAETASPAMPRTSLASLHTSMSPDAKASIGSPRASRDTEAPGSPVSLSQMTGMSSPTSASARSPPPSAGGRRSQSNRRRAIDVQRPNVSSPTSDYSYRSSSSYSGIPPNGRSASLARTGSQASELLGSSPETTRGLKSPRSSSGSKKLFSLGRKSKDKRNRRKSGSGEEDEEDDIPTTVDPSLIESRSSIRSATSPTDRSQKTLSVILREADEAMSGIDGEDGGDGFGDGDHDDDEAGGAFDFDIDLDGDDGIEVER